MIVKRIRTSEGASAVAVRWGLAFSYLFMCTLISPHQLWCQEAEIFSGHVYDASSKPVPYATVTAAPRSRAPTVTDSYGLFTLMLQPSVKDGDPLLIRISKDGFRPLNVQLNYSPFQRDMPFHLLSRNTVPTAGNARPTIKVRWPATGDSSIDQAQASLNVLPAGAPDASITQALRFLFDEPVFAYIGEELPETALYRFCRSGRLLAFYAPTFSDPAIRTAALGSTQRLIAIQDVLGTLFGPAFSAQTFCTRYGDKQDIYLQHLPSRMKDRQTIEERSGQLLAGLRQTLYAAGMLTSAGDSSPAGSMLPPLSESPQQVPAALTCATPPSAIYESQLRNSTASDQLGHLGEAAYGRGDYAWSCRLILQAKRVSSHEMWREWQPFLAVDLYKLDRDQDAGEVLDDLLFTLTARQGYYSRATTVGFVLDNLQKTRSKLSGIQRARIEDVISKLIDLKNDLPQ